MYQSYELEDNYWLAGHSHQKNSCGGPWEKEEEAVDSVCSELSSFCIGHLAVIMQTHAHFCGVSPACNKYLCVS